ncbi:MAG: hypothetical protein V4850_08950 [Myxococcota bacterium]
MRVVGTLSVAQVSAVAEAAAHVTLEKAVRWVAPRGGDIVDIVVQDEFTHDVVVGVAGVFLVYDTT